MVGRGSYRIILGGREGEEIKDFSPVSDVYPAFLCEQVGESDSRWRREEEVSGV